MGGRGDATNVISRPAACAITSISMDHRDLLGDTLQAIAAEKAGIMKPGVPVVTGAQPGEALEALSAAAHRVGAPLLARGQAWDIIPHGAGLRFTDQAEMVDLPAPATAMDGQFTRRGTDTVAGLACTEWETLDTQGLPTLACFTADGVLLRARRGAAVFVEAVQVSYGPPDPAAFVVPPSYKHSGARR